MLLPEIHDKLQILKTNTGIPTTNTHFHYTIRIPETFDSVSQIDLALEIYSHKYLG